MDNGWSKPVKNVFVLFAALGLLGLGACNTVEGLGEDVQASGEAVENAAEETKEAL